MFQFLTNVSLLCTKIGGMITIALEGMQFHAYVGWYEEEKVLGNEMTIDLYLDVNLNQTTKDSLPETLDYERVFETVKQVMEAKMHLMETVCQQIITSVALLSKSIEKIKVRVCKLNPPITGRLQRVFVEEEWKREN